MTADSLPLEMPLGRAAKDAAKDTAKGAPQAGALYRELRRPLLRYLICLGLAPDEAEDAVQDAFVALQRHLASGRPAEQIRGWLFRVAHNRARNQQSSYERRFAAPLETALEGAEPARGSASTSPEQSLLDKEKLRQTAKAIAALSGPERECLLLRAGGLRYREIAEVLGLPVSTVGDTVDRAVRKLAQIRNQTGDETRKDATRRRVK